MKIRGCKLKRSASTSRFSQVSRPHMRKLQATTMSKQHAPSQKFEQKYSNRGSHAVQAKGSSRLVRCSRSRAGAEHKKTTKPAPARPNSVSTSSAWRLLLKAASSLSEKRIVCGMQCCLNESTIGRHSASKRRFAPDVAGALGGTPLAS